MVLKESVGLDFTRRNSTAIFDREHFSTLGEAVVSIARESAPQRLTSSTLISRHVACLHCENWLQVVRDSSEGSFRRGSLLTK
jgi:hypothetical protein